jgi:hypothetical protein
VALRLRKRLGRQPVRAAFPCHVIGLRECVAALAERQRAGASSSGSGVSNSWARSDSSSSSVNTGWSPLGWCSCQLSTTPRHRGQRHRDPATVGDCGVRRRHLRLRTAPLPALGPAHIAVIPAEDDAAVSPLRILTNLSTPNSLSLARLMRLTGSRFGMVSR